jgi:hypothetical protein
LKPTWRARDAWAAGLALFALETAQSVLLLPLLPRWMPVSDVTLWISLTAGLGLVNAAAAAYAQPLVRSLAAHGSLRGLPLNWQTLRRQTDRHGLALLLVMLSVLAVFLARQVHVWSWMTTLAVVIFFAALVCKLIALNRFVALNGLAQIGRDKRILLAGSAVTLGAALILAPSTGEVWGLALASLIGATVSAAMAARAVNGLGHNAQREVVPWPRNAEMWSLVALSLSGYLNMGTDVLVANHFLPAPHAVSYAFWSRALFSLCLLAGMYTQIQFPRWAQAEAPALRIELRRALLTTLALPALAMLAYAVIAQSPWGAQLCLLPTWQFVTLSLTAGLCCAVVICGQVSNARGAYAFMLPSAWVACCAPLFAGVAGMWEPGAFVLGYAVANAALLVFNVRHAFAALQATAKP